MYKVAVTLMGTEPDWELHQIYADEGITGTFTQKRLSIAAKLIGANRKLKWQGMVQQDRFLAVFIAVLPGTPRGVCGLRFVKSRVGEIDVLGVHLLLAQPQTLAEMINLSKAPESLYLQWVRGFLGICGTPLFLAD